MLITNNPELANYGENCGVGRIFIDLEVNGKQERQGHLDTLISQHSMGDIPLVKESSDQVEGGGRGNPGQSNTQREGDQARK